MTENENKIINKSNSIDKNELFAKCDGDWRIARAKITMLLRRKLNLSVDEAYKKALQLRPERESFYSLID